jgi:xylulokinase
VKENEPSIYEKIHKIMLPGDYIAYKLTGRMTTTESGLSEGICWDFKSQGVADKLLDYYGFEKNILSEVVPAFGEQGLLTHKAAQELNLPENIPVSYRAGDQPNNAYSLRVLNPGEIAATAGTSGVVYGVTDEINYDELSRVNTFLHVNNTRTQRRNGILLCINGTGIANSWIRKNMDFSGYEQMNRLAEKVSPGANDLIFFPFGNGAERILENQNKGARLINLDFNVHGRAEVARSVQEGIVYALRYGLEVMIKDMGMEMKVFRAGNTNMFLSPVFRKVFSDVTGGVLEIYDTDGAQGAARAAGVGVKYYANFDESFIGLKKIVQIEPDKTLKDDYNMMYLRWKDNLERFLNQ